MLKSIFLAFALFHAGFAPAQHVSVARPAITGISHITLYADDMPKSQQFYQSLLGWDMVPPGHAKSGVRFYANHLQYIELISPPRPGIVDHLDCVGFYTSNAEALRRFLGAHGISVPTAVTVGHDGGRSFLVHDPEGNRIEFTQEGNRPVPIPKSAPRRVSSHIVHAGYVVRNRALLDHFYKDLLGFHLYWQGGATEGRIDWVMMQVPNGTDWIEYMLYLPIHPSRAQVGSANHFSPGVVSIAKLQKELEQRGWRPPANRNPQVLGVDGKLQLDLTDPDGTRVEFMEFFPIKKPCCFPYSGTQPHQSALAW